MSTCVLIVSNSCNMGSVVSALWVPQHSGQRGEEHPLHAEGDLLSELFGPLVARPFLQWKSEYCLGTLEHFFTTSISCSWPFTNCFLEIKGSGSHQLGCPIACGFMNLVITISFLSFFRLLAWHYGERKDKSWILTRFMNPLGIWHPSFNTTGAHFWSQKVCLVLLVSHGPDSGEPSGNY